MELVDTVFLVFNDFSLRSFTKRLDLGIKMIGGGGVIFNPTLVPSTSSIRLYMYMYFKKS